MAREAHVKLHRDRAWRRDRELLPESFKVGLQSSSESLFLEILIMKKNLENSGLSEIE